MTTRANVKKRTAKTSRKQRRTGRWSKRDVVTKTEIAKVTLPTLRFMEAKAGKG